MLRHILPIARYTLLEALRNRLLWQLFIVITGVHFSFVGKGLVGEGLV